MDDQSRSASVTESTPDFAPEEHRGYLLKFALLQLRDPHLAEDAVQETLLAALWAREGSPACFSCHTDYAMFGDVPKRNGLRHVYVHYLGEIPTEFELYQPYPNHNCLHCHEDGRRFIEAPSHADKLEALSSGATSCLECHKRGHALEQVEEGNFWLSQ